MTVYFQPVQDIQISTRASRAQYQYTLIGTNADEVGLWAERLAERLHDSPIMRDVASEAQDERPAHEGPRRPRDAPAGSASRMQAVNDTLNNAFGQRQISTIYAQANQYRVILEAMPHYQQRSRLAVAGSTCPAPAACRCRCRPFARFEHITAPLSIAHQEQFPAVTISFNLAPHAALSDAVAAIERGRARHRHADVGDRQLFRRRRRIRAARSPASRG